MADARLRNLIPVHQPLAQILSPKVSSHEQRWEKWNKNEAYPTKGVLKFYTDGSRLDSRAGYGTHGPGVDMAVPLGRLFFRRRSWQ
ncbi:hypothetical protein J6590_062844 [Homalodisca vitripennis]|nr:hypothetical protein J6590_062844 [Homalodisca vitripennis]